MARSTIAREDRPKRGTLNKRAILDASALLFQEKGYDRTSLDDIARALSVTKPSLYYHVSNKEEILLECVMTAYSNFQEEIARRDNPNQNGRKRVETFLKLYLQIISNDIGVSMVLADDRVMSPDGRAKYNSLRRILNNRLEELITIGIADGSISAPETKLTTFAIFGMFNWVGHWNFRRSTISTDAIFDRFISVIFDGIGTD